MRFSIKNFFTIVLMTIGFYFMPIHALKAETLKFVFSDFPPFEFGEGRSVKGINKEMLEEACQRLNVTPVFLKLPWKRALAYVKHGKGMLFSPCSKMKNVWNILTTLKKILIM